MDLVYFFIGGLIFAIALFKRELLIIDRSFKALVFVCIGLFLAGLALHFSEPIKDSTSGALFSPLLCLGLFRIFRRWFVQQFNREPRDTWFIWQSGMGADRVFNIVFFSSALCVWVFTTVATIEVGKAGF